MFYWLYTSLDPHQHYIPLLNLMKYLTFRTGLALFTAQIVVGLMGNRFIDWMRKKQGRGQPIRADGIARHVIEKAGTPTMGGVMILAGVMVGTLLWGDLSNAYVWAVILVTGGYGALGFSDDYAKVTKQTTAGVSGRIRLALEVVIALAAITLMIWHPGTTPSADGHFATSLAFPLFKKLLLDLGWFYLIFGAFIIVGAGNAVNFTDGLDGLAIVPVMIAAGAFGFIAYMVGNVKFANYLDVHFVRDGVVRRAYRGRHGLFVVQRAPGPHLHGRHRIAGAGRRARHRGGGLQARDCARHHRRAVRDRDPLGDDPGQLFQAFGRQAHLPDGADPPPF
jgi:phospho-N-acetylmuramoyl-pentapeptide-transferase